MKNTVLNVPWRISQQYGVLDSRTTGAFRICADGVGIGQAVIQEVFRRDVAEHIVKTHNAMITNEELHRDSGNPTVPELVPQKFAVEPAPREHELVQYYREQVDTLATKFELRAAYLEVIAALEQPKLHCFDPDRTANTLEIAKRNLERINNEIIAVVKPTP